MCSEASPPPPVFAILDVIWLIAILAMTCGYRTRVITIVALVVYTFSATFVYSHGKISHQIAIVMILLCMAIADWGKAAPRRVAQGLSLLAVGARERWIPTIEARLPPHPQLRRR